MLHGEEEKGEGEMEEGEGKKRKGGGVGRRDRNRFFWPAVLSNSKGIEVLP
jgi:hypothetical protein